MNLKKGDMVRPRIHRYRWKDGTLAIVINTGTDFGSPDDLQILWLNGAHRGERLWDYRDLFVKVTERNHA